MCVLLFGASICLIIVLSSGQNITKYGTEETMQMISAVNRINALTPIHNQTYIEKAENMIRMPLINQLDEHRNRRNMKKPPKRIIQKIIKKNRARSKKFYVYHVTSRPTMKPMVDVDNNNMYPQDEQSQWKEDSSTTQSHQKKKNRKWMSKLPRYPMPFQKLQFKKDTGHKRSRREVRDDVFILKDLDEMEFLSKKDGYTVVNAHVKKYW